MSLRGEERFAEIDNNINVGEVKNTGRVNLYDKFSESLVGEQEYMFNKMTLAVKAYGDARLPVDLLPEVSEESLSHLRTRMFGEVSDNVVVRGLNQNLKKRLYFKFLNGSSQVCTESLHQVLLAVSEANQEITAKFSEELVEILE